jgi:hypothetical protein
MPRQPIPMDEMKQVVKCPMCGSEEYFGMIHWRLGHQYCRACIYKIWAKYGTWKPSARDHVFPLYEDGVDYTKEEDT